MLLSFSVRALLAASLVSGSVIPASADNYVFRYRQHVGEAAVSPPDSGDPDTEFGVGNDITVYFTGGIGYEFSKAIPVATADVVEWRRVSGSYQPGLALDADAGVISGVATGTTAQRKVLLLGYDVGGKAIARANITFTFVNPVGAPQGLVFYGHTNQHLMQEIPASVPVARWEKRSVEGGNDPSKHSRHAVGWVASA